MSSEKRQRRVRRVDRREFVAIGVRTAAALGALPAASLVAAGCGSGEEPREPTAPAPSRPPARPAEAPPPRAAAPSPAPAEAGAGQLVTEIAALAPLVSGLQYANESPKPDQNCAGCQLYTAGAGGRGKCQLFAQGVVKETGWCASWVARIT
jgi:hypothetical protein